MKIIDKTVKGSKTWINEVGFFPPVRSTVGKEKCPFSWERKDSVIITRLRLGRCGLRGWLSLENVKASVNGGTLKECVMFSSSARSIVTRGGSCLKTKDLL